jgi:hypothetical protein
MPLLPYVNGLAMQITGFGLFEQRAVNGLWAALTILLMGLWLARHTSQAWAIGFAAFLSLSVSWMYYIHLGKTYALTGLVVIAAFWVFTEWTPGVRKVCLLALLGTIGVGCRLPAAPYFAMLWLGAGMELLGQPARHWLAAGIGSLVWPVILLLPFYCAAPEATQFWMLDLHRIAVPHKTWHLSLIDIASLSPALWLSLGATLCLAVKTRSNPGRNEAAIIVATLLTLALNLLARGVYDEYAVPFLPPLVLIVALGIWRAGATLSWFRHAAIPVSLLLLNLAASVAMLWSAMPPARRGSWSMFLPLSAPDYNFTLPAGLARARQVVKDYLPQNQPFIGPHLILAVEAGRIVPRTLRMGAFTATSDYPPAQARQLNLATLPELDAYFNDSNVPLVALTKTNYLNYAWSMPSHRYLSAHRGADWFEIFQRDFFVAYEDHDFLILVRKNAGARTP